ISQTERASIRREATAGWTARAPSRRAARTKTRRPARPKIATACPTGMSAVTALIAISSTAKAAMANVMNAAPRALSVMALMAAENLQAIGGRTLEQGAGRMLRDES